MIGTAPPLLELGAAIHGDVSACDPPRAVRSEKRDDLRNIRGLPDALERLHRKRKAPSCLGSW